ncbi:MAG TPA: sulfurtransferase [Xanthobacteraceae bacterium]|nr:sulfurtransferase [Xanthobacteraceae bacterium]
MPSAPAGDPNRFLVETDWLADRLGDPQLRVFDCSVRLIPDPQLQYRVEDCRADYRAGHVPGAGYIDLHNDLSDKQTGLRFMAPTPEAFARAMSRYGVDDSTRVVLYAKGTWYWATRVWWMLRANGFDNAAVLNGGWQKWQAEGRPIATGEESYPAARFVSRPRPELFCDKHAVLAAIADPQTKIINALTPEQHAGTGGTAFGRPGHIKNSVNVSAKDLVDGNNVLLPPAELRRRFAAVGALDASRCILYCGGGISATGNAFALSLLGYAAITVYDGSLNEWGSDPALPMETGLR